ncbi:glutamyl-tRNA reductase domain protein [Chlamydia psittaci VS225]|nr:glutamyl-tRNA reductase domain protein [Chlamydia psittaci VS225]
MVLGVVGISYREAALKEREAVINILKDFEADSFFLSVFSVMTDLSFYC